MLPFFKKLPPCLVGMEACATSHHWARQLIGLGHEVKLMPPHYVKALCEAQQERCGGRSSHLRGSDSSNHALCVCEDAWSSRAS